jgi:hypothetical protein
MRAGRFRVRNGMAVYASGQMVAFLFSERNLKDAFRGVKTVGG